jgi:hypothetical protein
MNAQNPMHARMNSTITPRLRALATLTAAALLSVACGSSNSLDGGSGGGGGGGQDVGAVNVYSTDDQQRPTVASNRAGKAVIVWESMGQDGNHLGLFARRFESGVPVGDEFQVNTYTDSRQSFPTAAMDAAGNFVVAWRSSRQGSPGGTIYAQRFAADGTRIGSEFLVGPDDSDRDSQSEPQMAMDADGRFMIAWSNRELGVLAEQLGQNQLEERWLEIRSYNVDGTPRIAPTRTTNNTDDQFPRAPRIGMDANSNIVLVWASAGAGTNMRAQHFDLDGNALSPAYTVNTVSAAVGVDLATVAVAPDGSFAVAWEGYTFGYTPVGIIVRRYAGPQAPLGDEHIVSSPANGLVERNSIALNANGDLVVAAHANDRVYLAVERADGSVSASVNVSGGPFSALFPSVAISGEDQVLVAWQNLGQDGDGRGIRARTLAIP